ncbi:hypothetical protein BOTBODRAFT_26552 [Botryobasidium botryosum FD-172 SS1]|uniref:Uncharacterized protein n=1 Tax=Botryobasidium botryosum (strain FD-172 SS1) TaxID=930990 RepID=A0A067N8S5_BOTB1|nr:hypothetical protein BOTBODRAFT_26552 [Botryobasidium botryosum FD-172 SS1]
MHRHGLSILRRTSSQLKPTRGCLIRPSSQSRALPTPTTLKYAPLETSGGATQLMTAPSEHRARREAEMVLSEPPVDTSYLAGPSTSTAASVLRTHNVSKASRRAKRAPKQYHKPQSRNGFLRYLVYHLNQPKPPSLAKFLEMHDTYSSLHTIHSYNLLLALSLQRSSHATTTALLARMREEGIQPNKQTWKLITRFHVQYGRTAIAEEIFRQGSAAYRDSATLDVWKELLGTIKRVKDPNGIPSTRSAVEPGQPMDSETPATTPTPPSLPNVPREVDIIELEAEEFSKERTRRILSNLLTLSPAEAAELPAPAVWSLVRYFLNLHPPQPETALSITRLFIARLPPEPSESQLSQTMSLIHLHLRTQNPSSFPTKTPTPSIPPPSTRAHYEHRRLLRTLLNLHPALKPNTETLTFLLGSLRRTKHRGTQGHRLVKFFAAKWGEGLAKDPKIERLLASLALSEGNLDLAEFLMKVHWEHDAPVEENTGDWYKGPILPSRAKKAERILWSRVRERLKKHRLREIEMSEPTS